MDHAGFQEYCAARPPEPFAEVVALGLREGDRTHWVRMHIDATTVTMLEPRELAAIASIREIGATLAVSASGDTWEAIAAGGQAALMESLKNQSFRLLGDMSFFVRHLERIVAFLSS
jgi:hypothetical protein